MKIASLFNKKLTNKCPICKTSEHYSIYINADECKSAAHNLQEIIFFKHNDRIVSLEFIEGKESIFINLEDSEISIECNENIVHIPLGNLKIKDFNLKKIKDLMIFQ
jgi:hypothetical protein